MDESHNYCRPYAVSRSLLQLFPLGRGRLLWNNGAGNAVSYR